MTDVKFLMLDSNTWNYLDYYKQMSSVFIKVLPPNYSLANQIYLINIYVLTRFGIR